MSNSDVLVEIHGVSMKLGGRYVLKDIDLVIKDGLTLVLGPNGSGKSTLIKLITGVWKPTRGFIRVFNMDPWRSGAKLKNHISVAYEDLDLPPNITPLDFLMKIASIKKIEFNEVTNVIKLFELNNYITKPFSQLSHGFKRRTLLAQALIGKPSLIVLDEPLSGLDKFFRKKFVKILARLLEEKSVRGVIVTSHIPLGIEPDMTVVINNGVIQEVITGTR